MFGGGRAKPVLRETYKFRIIGGLGESLKIFVSRCTGPESKPMKGVPDKPPGAVLRGRIQQPLPGQLFKLFVRLCKLPERAPDVAPRDVFGGCVAEPLLG